MAASNSTQRFSSRVDNYVLYRPGYPPEVLETLQRDCGLTSSSVVADVGSGTGLLTKVFLDNGNSVFAVEPNQDMREAGERSLGGYPRFTSVDGTAEATTLPSHTVDLVTAGQAAHWFDLAQARAEFARILKPNGWAVLVWNERKTASTPFLVEYENLLVACGTDYSQVRHERTTERIGSFFDPASYQSKTFQYRQTFDYASLQGRLLSSSYTPLPSDSRYAPMLSELRRLFDTHQSGGHIAFEYETRMYYGQLA